MKDFEIIYEKVEAFVTYKFYKNLFDEMTYHGYAFESQKVDEIIHLVFKKNQLEGDAEKKRKKDKQDESSSLINVIIISHKRQNKHFLLARKNDFMENIDPYINKDAENLIIYDNDDIKKSLIKHTTKAQEEHGVMFVLRGKQSYICNIFDTLEADGYSIASKEEIKGLETMRVLPNFADVAPLLDVDDVIARMLRAKRGDFVKREDLDPSIKSFTTKFFLVK